MKACNGCGTELNEKYKHDGTTHDNCKATARNIGVSLTTLRIALAQDRKREGR